MSDSSKVALDRLWSFAAGWRTYDHAAARKRLESLVAEGRLAYNDLRFFESAQAAFGTVLNAVRPGPLPGVVALWAASDALYRDARAPHGMDGEYQRRTARWLDACADQLQAVGDDEAAASQEVRTALGIARALLGEEEPAAPAEVDTETVTSEPNAALYMTCPLGHPLALRTTTASVDGEARGMRHDTVCPKCEADGTVGLIALGGADG